LPNADSGVVSGCQPLKEPATYTRCATGSTNSRATRAERGGWDFAGAVGAAVGAACTGTGIAASDAASLTLTTAFFVFLVAFM